MNEWECAYLHGYIDSTSATDQCGVYDAGEGVHRDAVRVNQFESRLA